MIRAQEEWLGQKTPLLTFIWASDCCQDQFQKLKLSFNQLMFKIYLVMHFSISFCSNYWKKYTSTSDRIWVTSFFFYQTSRTDSDIEEKRQSAIEQVCSDIGREDLTYWFYLMSFSILSFVSLPKSFSPKEPLCPPPGRPQTSAKPLRSIKKVSVFILLLTSDFFLPSAWLWFSCWILVLWIPLSCCCIVSLHLQVLCLQWLLRSQKNTQVGVSFEEL